MCPFPSSTLTIAVFFSLALLLLVPLITGRGSVQAPVQEIAQQHLLLIRQLCSGRGYKARSVGLHGVIASPWEKIDKQCCSSESLEHLVNGTNKHILTKQFTHPLVDANEQGEVETRVIWLSVCELPLITDFLTQTIN